MSFKLVVILVISTVSGNGVRNRDFGSDPYVKKEVKSEEFGIDYLSESEYAADTFSMKIEEKMCVEKRELTDFERKYEYEEEIVRSDSPSRTPLRKIHAFDEKLCRICHVKFRFAVHYEKHFNDDHPNRNPYGCPCCPYSEIKRSNFIFHIKKKHADELFVRLKIKRNKLTKCDVCRTEHGSLKNFQIHNASRHKGMKMFKCTVCDVRFSWFGNLMRHEMDKHGMHDAEFLCKSCKTIFLRSDEMETHVAECEKKQSTKKKMGSNQIDINSYENDDDDGNTCHKCGEKFRNIPLLTDHSQTCHPELKGCTVGETRGKDLPTTVETDEIIERRQGGKFRKKRKYEGQFRREKLQGSWRAEGRVGKNRKSFDCAECGECFSRKHVLQQHLVSVHEVPTAPCRYCKKLLPRTTSTSTSEWKNEHEKTCGKKRMRERSKLGKDTSQRMRSKNEKSRGVRNGEKLYRCDACDQTFDSAVYLRYHIKRNHGKADILCPHCQKCFTLSYEMKRHEEGCGKKRADQGLKFFCDICRITLYGSAKYHTKRHENYDYCAVCKDRFHRANNPQGLSIHMKKRHPDHFSSNDKNDNANALSGEVQITKNTPYSEIGREA